MNITSKNDENAKKKNAVDKLFELNGINKLNEYINKINEYTKNNTTKYGTIILKKIISKIFDKVLIVENINGNKAILIKIIENCYNNYYNSDNHRIILSYIITQIYLKNTFPIDIVTNITKNDPHIIKYIKNERIISKNNEIKTQKHKINTRFLSKIGITGHTKCNNDYNNDFSNYEKYIIQYLYFVFKYVKKSNHNTKVSITTADKTVFDLLDENKFNIYINQILTLDDFKNMFKSEYRTTYKDNIENVYNYYIAKIYADFNKYKSNTTGKNILNNKDIIGIESKISTIYTKISKCRKKTLNDSLKFYFLYTIFQLFNNNYKVINAPSLQILLNQFDNYTINSDGFQSLCINDILPFLKNRKNNIKGMKNNIIEKFITKLTSYQTVTVLNSKNVIDLINYNKTNINMKDNNYNLLIIFYIILFLTNYNIISKKESKDVKVVIPDKDNIITEYNDAIKKTNEIENFIIDQATRKTSGTHLNADEEDYAVRIEQFNNSLIGLSKRYDPITDYVKELYQNYEEFKNNCNNFKISRKYNKIKFMKGKFIQEIIDEYNQFILDYTKNTLNNFTDIPKNTELITYLKKYIKSIEDILIKKLLTPLIDVYYKIYMYIEMSEKYTQVFKDIFLTHLNELDNFKVFIFDMYKDTYKKLLYYNILFETKINNTYSKYYEKFGINQSPPSNNIEQIEQKTLPNNLKSNNFKKNEFKETDTNLKIFYKLLYIFIFYIKASFLEDNNTINTNKLLSFEQNTYINNYTILILCLLKVSET